MEILHQHRDPIHAIFVAIGGGGLVAGLQAYVKRAALAGTPVRDQTLVAVAGGANIDFDRLGFVAERGLHV